jgi:hypothetical protein
MPASNRLSMARLVSRFFALLQKRTERRSRRNRPLTSLFLEHLEDRLTPSSVSDYFGTLTITLDEPGDSLIIAASGAKQMTLTSTNALAVSDIANAGLSGATLSGGQLTLTSDSQVDIVDLATGGTVVFADSGSQQYAEPITVNLSNPFSGGVTFNGASTFAHGLTVSTVDGDIVSAAGSSIKATGDLSLTSSTNITLNGSTTVTGTGSSGNLNLTANGTITLGGAASVSGNSTFDANGAVTAANAANSFGGSVIVEGASYGNPAASASVIATGTLKLDTINVTGGLTATSTGPIVLSTSSGYGSSINVGGALTVSAGGPITQSSGLTVTGNASFKTTSGDIVVGDSGNAFSGDISASVVGAGNITLDSGTPTITLGTIQLGTGNLTVNDDDYSGSSTIVEDGAMGGITTDPASTATLSFNISYDYTANIDLSEAANNIGGGATIAANGSNFNYAYGDFSLQDTNAAASVNQLVFNQYTANGLNLNFPQAAGGIAIDSLPSFYFSDNLSLRAAGDITENVNSLTVYGNASFTSTSGNVTIVTSGDAAFNTFGGDLSASVGGTNNIQLENSNSTTTLGTVSLGTGSFTLTDDDQYGSSTITEDPTAASAPGIHTGTPPANTAQIVLIISTDSYTNINLNTAPNSIASTYAVQINGQPSGGTSGDLGYRSTSPGAGISQLTLNQFSVNNLTLELDSTSANIDLGDLASLGIPGSSGDVTLTVGGNITEVAADGTLSFPGNLTMSAGGSINIASPLNVTSALGLTSGAAIILSAAVGVNSDAMMTSGAGVSVSAPLTIGGNLTAKATGDIAFTAAIDVTGNITLTSAGNITQDTNGAVTAYNATFTVTGGSSQINLTNTSNDVLGVVSFIALPTDSGAIAFTNSADVVLGSSSLGDGTVSLTAGGGGTVTEEGGATIIQGKSGGQVSVVASSGATDINLSGDQNIFTGPVSFSGSTVTSVQLENANPVASPASVNVTGIAATPLVELIFDGPTASIQLATMMLAYSLDLIETNDVVLPATAVLTVTGANNLTFESENGSVNLIGTVKVPGVATLQSNGGANSGVETINPTSTFGTLDVISSGGAADTIVSGGALTLGDSSITGNAGTASLTINSAATIQQANSTSLSVRVPLILNVAQGDIDLTSTGNILSGAISATVTGTHSVTLTNSGPTTTIGTIEMGSAVIGTVGTLTFNDAHSGGGSGVVETAQSAIITEGPVVVNIANDATANVNLGTGTNLFELDSITVNGISAGTTGDLGFRNAAPNASTSQLLLNHFSISNLLVDFDLSAINVGASFPAFSSSGDLVLISGGGNITQSVPIVTSGSANFSIEGFIGDASIILTNPGNKIASGAGSTISFDNPLADNKQTVALVNTADIDLGASSIGLGALTLTTTGNIISTASIRQAAGGGAVTLSAGGTTISLTSTSDDFYGPVTYTGTGGNKLTTIGFSNSNPLATLPTITGLAPVQTSVTYELSGAPVLLGNVNAGSLLVQAGGNITQKAGTTLTVSGEATFTTDAFGIQLTNANTIAEASFNNSGENPVALTTTGALVLDTSDIGSGAFTITAGGPITQTSGFGILQTLPNNEVAAGAVTFDTPGNAVLLDNGDNFILGSISANASALTLADDGPVILGTDTLSGALTILSSTGSITQAPGGVVSVAGSAYLSAGQAAASGDSIELTNPGNSVAGPINLESSAFGANVALTFNGSVQLGGSSVQGMLSVTANGANGPANITQLAATSGVNSGTITAQGASFTSSNGSITLTNRLNDFGDAELSLSAAAGATLTDSDSSGVVLGPVNFGVGAFTLTASANVGQIAGAITGSGSVTIDDSSSLPANAIIVTLTQSGNDVTGAGAFTLMNVTEPSITNQGNIELGGSTIDPTSDVVLTAGGTVILPSGKSGTLTLGSLTATGNQIQLGNGGVNLTTTDYTGIHLTGNVVFNGGVTLDASAGGNIQLNGSVNDAAANQPLVFNLPQYGSLDFSGGTWNQGANKLTVTGVGETFTVGYASTLAMSGGQLVITGLPAAGGAPSTGNTLEVEGTLQVGGPVVVSDGNSGSIVNVNFEYGSVLSVALGSTDGSLTLAGLNPSDRITISSTAKLTGFGGSTPTGSTPILSVIGGGVITGSFANSQDSTGSDSTTGYFFMGSDIVNATYAPVSGDANVLSIQPKAAVSGSSTAGLNFDGEAYSISVTGGASLVVLDIPAESSQELDIVLRNATAATTLTITTTPNGGTGFTSVSNIAIDGPGAATIMAPTTNVAGNISVGGPLAGLTLNNWSNGTLSAGAGSVNTAVTANILTSDNINLQTPLTLLKAVEYTGTGTISASSFGAITIGSTAAKKPAKGGTTSTTGFTTPGNFSANLINTNLSAGVALASASISGALSGDWELAGSVGTVTVGVGTTNWTLGQPTSATAVNGGLLTSITSLSLGTASNVSIDASGSIGSITAVSLDDSASNTGALTTGQGESSGGGTLQARSFGSITITGTKGMDNGNFIANLIAAGSGAGTVLGSLTVAGNLGSPSVPTTFSLNGSAGAISALDEVQDLTIDAQGAIASINAGDWLNADVTAASIGKWTVTGNLAAHLLGNFNQGAVTLYGAPGGSTLTLGAMTVFGNLTNSTFAIVQGGATGLTVNGAMDNVTLALEGATGSLGSIVAGDWSDDAVTAASIGTLKSTGRAAASAATPALVGNIANSTIEAFAAGIGTVLAAGNLTTSSILANGTTTTFTINRTVSGSQVAANFNGGTGAIGTLTAGQWLDTDLSAYSLGSVTITGYATPDTLPGFTTGDFSNSDVVVAGSAASKSFTGGINTFTVGNNMELDSFNVPFGIGTLTVKATLGFGVELDLLNPLSAGSSQLGTLKAGAIQSLTLDANQVGSVTTTGAPQAPGDLDYSTLAVGFSGAGSNPIGIATLSVVGAMNGTTLNVKESITTFTVSQIIDGGNLTVAYDSANPTAAIKTLTAGSLHVSLTVGSIGTFTVTGNAAAGLAGNVTNCPVIILSSLKGIALGTFSATGTVYRSEFQVTSGNVTSFQTAFFIDSSLSLGYRYVDPLMITDAANNQTSANWEGNFTLGTFKTTAKPVAGVPASDSFQSSEVVAANLGTVTLSAVNPTPTIPSTIPFNGSEVSIPPVLLALANFGVGFRHQGGTGGKLEIGTTVESPGSGTTATLAPAFFYFGLGG